jgi:outer membrane protein insertion porin family
VHGIRRDGPSSGPLHGGVTIGRLMAGVDYSRPLRPKWSGTAGISFQVKRALILQLPCHFL